MGYTRTREHFREVRKMVLYFCHTFVIIIFGSDSYRLPKVRERVSQNFSHAPPEKTFHKNNFVVYSPSPNGKLGKTI